MNLLTNDLRLRRLSLALWVAATAVLVLMIVAIYPIVRDNPALDSIYADLGPGAQALLGGSDLTSPVGYLNTQLFAFLFPAVLLVFGVSRGTATVAGEEEDRTLDLLLAQPVTRRSVYLQKATAVVLGLGLLTLAAWLPIAALSSTVGFDLPLSSITAVCLQLGLFSAVLTLSAQGISAASGRRAVGAAVVGAYAFVSYLVFGLAGSVALLDHLKPLTLWRWYLGNDPLANGIGTAEVGVLLALAAIALALGVYGFQRRDLRA